MASFQEIISGENPVLIDFSAEWCQPCKMMPPILKQVKQQLGEKVRILKIDVDKNSDLAHKLAIQNVPTIMIFIKGEVKFRQAGVLQAQQLITQINQFI